MLHALNNAHCILTVVPRVGLEPTRLAAPDFESGTSTNSITEAGELSGREPLRGESVTNTALISDYGNRMVDPVVLRPSKSRWACTASFRA